MFCVGLLFGLIVTAPVCADAQVTAPVLVSARLSDTITPPWTQGIQAINQTNYWNAVECGKQGGANPACVFWDTGLCQNDQFTIAMFTPYKQVAYEVWGAVRAKKPVPTPSYSQAQRTRITIGVTPAKGSKNAITSVAVKRGGKTVAPVSKAAEGAGGSFTFDFPAFAPTADISLELVGKAGTVSCSVEKGVLALFR